MEGVKETRGYVKVGRGEEDASGGVRARDEYCRTRATSERRNLSGGLVFRLVTSTPTVERGFCRGITCSRPCMGPKSRVTHGSATGKVGLCGSVQQAKQGDAGAV